MLRTSTILVTIFLALAVTAANAHSMFEELPELRTADWIDLSRYTGTWYEIASIPEIFEYKCTNSQATYTAEKDYILVHNQCNRNSFDGILTEVDGKAYPTEESNARLKVYFFKLQPVAGDYWVIELDEDYNWAIVGVPSRKSGWILSRTPQISDELLKELYQRLRDQSYDVTKFKPTPQQKRDAFSFD
jgi:apolipoprotein D and lipocalin family protein